MKPSFCERVNHPESVETWMVDEEFLTHSASLFQKDQGVMWDGAECKVTSALKTPWFTCFASIFRAGSEVLLVGQYFMKNNPDMRLQRDVDFDQKISRAGNVERAAKACGVTIAEFKTMAKYQQRQPLITAAIEGGLI